METTVKASAPERPLPTGSSYLLQHLDNEDELLALIKESEINLHPCAHCGDSKPSIRYEFLPGTEEPHRFHAWCCGHDGSEDTPSIGCWMRTFVYRATDDVEAIMYALRIVVSKWNRRPGEPFL